MLSTVLLLASLTLPSSPQSDPDLRHWNQPWGTADLSSAIELEPVTGDPVEAWERADLIPGSDVVCWDPIAFFTTRTRGKTALRAVRVTTGEDAGIAQLGRVDEVRLACWQGLVAAVLPDKVQIMRWKDDRLRTVDRIKGVFTGTPRICDGFLFLRTGGVLAVVIDLVAGKEVERFGVKKGLPSLDRLAGEGTLAYRTAQWQRTNGQPCLVQSTILVEGLEPGASSVRSRFGEEVTLPLSMDQPMGGPVRTRTLESGWTYFESDASLQASTRDDHRGVYAFSNGFLPSLIKDRSVWYDERLIGFSVKGELIDETIEGERLTYIPHDALPAGAEPHTPSMAGPVIYFGDWAIHADERRVLWNRPDWKADAPAVPASDGIVLIRSGSRLIGVKQGEIEGLALASSAPPDPRLRPDEKSGLIDTEGRLWPGTVVDGKNGDVQVRVDDEELTFPADRVGAHVEEGVLQGSVREFAVYRAWIRALERSVLEPFFEDRFEDYLDRKAPAEGRRLVQEARDRWNLPAAFVERLDQKLVGRAAGSASTSEGQKEFAQRKEVKEREKAVKSFLEAANWLADQGLTTAATALMTDASHFSATSTIPAEACDTWRPDEAPFDDVATWMQWAPELLPADARFVSLDDPRIRRAPPIWRSNTFVLQTDHLVLFTREHDPSIVGPCLRNGEGAVRVLESMHRESGVPLPTNPPRLEIRLHRDRKAYLEEQAPDGTFAMPWSAGYYAPSEQVSRFYVEREENSAQQARSLNKVLVHELTHHYIDLRWAQAERGGQRVGLTPGHWIVEGFARFVEDQVVELGRRAPTLDDETVQSLETAAAVLEKNGLFELETFLDATGQQWFGGLLDDAPLFEVTLKTTLGASFMTRRGIFYEQSGSLVFFLLHRTGPEGRAAFFEYLTSHYAGRLGTKSYRALGFDDVQSLEDAYTAFLTEL